MTKAYKKAPKSSFDNVNLEAKEIAGDDRLDDRIDTMATKNAFITLKDHKPNFDNNPTCRLINPAKSDIGVVSKSILDKINIAIKQHSEVNQWKSTSETINWFKSIKDKQNCSFIVFDIVDFYPSISLNPLTKVIECARQFISISESDEGKILHSRKSFLFTDDKTWIKRKTTGANPFDVSMGCYDGAEVCELVGLYILNNISDLLDDVGLYRDDGLAVIRGNPSNTERIKKRLCAKFTNDFGLKITADTNLKAVNYLDVTFDLHQGVYKPYRKPNDNPVYINTKSNHPPNIFKELPNSINKRLSTLSDSENTFKEAIPVYQKALSESGFSHDFKFHDTNSQEPPQEPKKRQRSRETTWFNPPYSKNVTTNIGKEFFKLLDRHFPKGSPLAKIFNRNTVKLSYSCTPNLKSIISAHNKRILETPPADDQQTCSCPRSAKATCPLDGNCLTRNIVYKATVTAESAPTMNYIGLASTTFKERLGYHTLTFNHERYEHGSELSKHNLCIAEKFFIMTAPRHYTLNKRSELVSMCRHKRKHKLNAFGVT